MITLNETSVASAVQWGSDSADCQIDGLVEVMAQWKTRRITYEKTEFIYRVFRSEGRTTIDLDDSLLRELVELFVGAYPFTGLRVR